MISVTVIVMYSGENDICCVTLSLFKICLTTARMEPTTLFGMLTYLLCQTCHTVGLVRVCGISKLSLVSSI